MLVLTMAPPVFLAMLTGRRWALPRFRLHRLGGLSFLCTYAYGRLCRCCRGCVCVCVCVFVCMCVCV